MRNRERSFGCGLEYGHEGDGQGGSVGSNPLSDSGVVELPQKENPGLAIVGVVELPLHFRGIRAWRLCWTGKRGTTVT